LIEPDKVVVNFHVSIGFREDAQQRERVADRPLHLPEHEAALRVREHLPEVDDVVAAELTPPQPGVDFMKQFRPKLKWSNKGLPDFS
jgi:hypothetical protein